MFKITRSLILGLLIFIQTINGDTDCNDYRECYDDVIDDDSIICDGYESCLNSQLNFDDEAYCGGYLGCASSELESSTGDVSCPGYQSCQNSNITSQGLVCDGSSGCYDFSGDVDGTVECDGYESCKDAYIYVRPTSSSSNRRYIYVQGNRAGQNLYLRLKGNDNKYTIYVSGYYGLENGTIYSGQGNDVNIHFLGYYSGYNATLLCKKNSDCDVTCYGDYACVGFTKTCTAQASCSVTYNYADQDYASNSIEKFNNLDLHNYKIGKKSIPVKTFGNIKKDSIVGDYSCYDDMSCADETISDITGNVECYGYASCNNSMITVSGDIQCYGYESCGSTTVDADNLVCDGPYSCSLTSGDVSGDLTCNGAYGCAGSSVSVDGDITFNGNYAGYNVDLEFSDDSGDHTVYFGGLLSFKNGIILSGEDNIINITFSGRLAGENGLFACDMNSICYAICIDYGCVDLNLIQYYGGDINLNCIGNAYCPDVSEIGTVDKKISQNEFLFSISLLNGYATDILNYIMNNIWTVALVLIFSALFCVGFIYNSRKKDFQYEPIMN